MPASSPVLLVYQKTVDAVMNGRDPATDPGVKDAIANAKAAGMSDADINSYYQSGVTAPSRTTGGGGFFGSITNSIPLIESVASALIPGAAPIIAGVNAAQSIASGKPINIGTALNIATAASGLPGASSALSDVTGIDLATLSKGISTAKTAVGAVNAVQTGNVAGMLSTIAQMADAGSDVKTALSAANAYTAYQKGDMAGVVSALNNITGTVSPSVLSLAKTVINTIDPTILASKPKTTSSAVDSSNTASNTDTSSTNVDTSTTTASNTATNTASTTVNPLAVPTGPTSASGQTVTNPLALPSMPTVKAPSATIGKINEIDLAKLFDQVNSLNPVQDTTINARSGGSINDLVQLLNSRG